MTTPVQNPVAAKPTTPDPQAVTMAPEPPFVSDARRLLKELASQLPQSVTGLERQMMIGDVLGRMDDGDKQKLRALLNYFLMRMLSISASDIDQGGYGAGGQVWFRVYGSKKPDKTLGQYTADETNYLIQGTLGERQRAFLYENRNLDFSYSIIQEENMYRFRADAYFDLDQIALNMRAINAVIRPYKSYEFHNEVTRIVSLAHTKEGLTLVTGITGSGKSTTLDAILDANNHSVDGHCVIIASPIEYVHKSDRCIIRHREVGRDTLVQQSAFHLTARETAKEKMVVALQPEQAPVADDEHHQFCIRYQRAVRQLQSA